jgi:hypothetical protein
VVIEPPGNFWRTGILEIYDSILVAIELFLIEQRASPMQEAGVNKLHIVAIVDSFAVETRKQGSRASPVKTFVVIKNPHSQIDCP